MNDIGIITFKNGGFTTVDTWLMPHLAQFKWRLSPNGYVRAHGAMKNGKRRHIALHRIVNATPKGLSTDHINGCRTDNRESNLRACTTTQNGGNRKHQSYSSSQYKGVCYLEEYGKWRATIPCGKNKRKTLGTFQTEREAGMAYNEAAKSLYGDFARLNNIQQEPPSVEGERKESSGVAWL